MGKSKKTQAPLAASRNVFRTVFSQRFPAGRLLAVITLLVLLGGFCCGIPLLGITSDSPKPLKFKRIGVEDNFIQKSVAFIYQDIRGFMWFGTGNGLVQYDGRRFRHFQRKEGGAREPQDNSVMCMAEDLRRRMWVGAGTVLERFDPAAETFVHYPKPPENQKEKERMITVILPDPLDADLLWIGAGDGLYRFHYNGRASRFEEVKSYRDAAASAKERTIYSLAADFRGDIWGVGLGMQLLHINRKSGEMETFRGKKGPWGVFPDDLQACIHFSRWSGDSLWIASYNGLLRLNITDGVLTCYESVFPDSSRGGKGLFHITDAQEPDHLWICSMGGGLHLFNMANGQCRTWRYDPKNSESPPSDLLNFSLQDSSGSLWLGSLVNGLARAENINKEFHQFTASGDLHSLSNNIVTALYESPNNPGTIWIGDFAGLSRYDAASMSITRIPVDESSPDGIWGMSFRSFYERPSQPGVLWIGTGEKGLNAYDYRRKKTLAHYLADQNGVPNKSGTAVSSILESPSLPGALWLGTFTKGLIKLELSSGNYVSLFPSPRPAMDLTVIFLHESPVIPGVLWLGTYEKGLIRFDIASQKMTEAFSVPAPMGKAVENNVYNVLETASEPGIFWLATNTGVFRFDARTGRVLTFPGEASLRSQPIIALLEDKRGHFWLSADNGIWKLDPQTGKIRHYAAGDGLRGYLFTSASLRATNGALYFAGVDGLSAFFPEKISDNLVPPVISLTELLLSNQPVPTGWSHPGEDPLLPKALPFMTDLHIPWSVKNFSLRFAAFNFNSPGANRYQYKMEGLDNEWIDAGSNREATFTGLKPGKYLFRVKGCNNDGVWNEIGVSLPVYIVPPWWRSTLAYFFYAVFAVLGLFLLNRRQRRRLVKREREKAQLHEAELRARAAEAQAIAMEAENRRKTQELEEARKIQLSMLPRRIPQLPFAEIAVYMKTAAEVGGDYYDFCISGDNALLAAAGDATGHGIRAGTMVSVFKGVFLSYAVNTRNSITEFLDHGSRVLRQIRLGNLFMGLSILRVEEKRAWIASAGMPPIYLHRAAKGKVEEFCFKSPPLGAFAGHRSQFAETLLFPGDTFLITSDGLPELFSPDDAMYGYSRLKEQFAAAAGLSPQHIIDRLASQAESWLNGKPQDDDITFVVIQMK